MSVTKTRPSGLSAMKRTRLSPSAATLKANPSGRFRTNDLPPESDTRFGTSLKAPASGGYITKLVDIDNTFWLVTLGGSDGKTAGLEPYTIKS